MATDHGKPLLHTLDRFLGQFEKIIALIAGVGVIAIMLAGCAEVLMRTLFRRPIVGVVDMVEAMMVGVALLGMAYCQSKGGNVRMTLLVSNLRGRASTASDALSYFIGFVFVSAVTYGAAHHLMNFLRLGGTSPQLGIPLWIVSSVALLSLVVLAIRLALQFVASVRLLVWPDAEPVGLPRSEPGIVTQEH